MKKEKNKSMQNNNMYNAFKIFEKSRKEWEISDGTKRLELICKIITDVNKLGLNTDRYAIREYFKKL